MIKTSSDSLFAGLLTNLDLCGFDIRNEHGKGGPNLRKVLEILASDGVYAARGLLKLSDEEILVISNESTGKNYADRLRNNSNKSPGSGSEKERLELLLGQLRARKKFYSNLAEEALDLEVARMEGRITDDEYSKRAFEMRNNESKFNQSMPSEVSGVDIDELDAAITNAYFRLDSLDASGLSEPAGKQDEAGIRHKFAPPDEQGAKTKIDKVRRNLQYVTNPDSFVYNTGKPQSGSKNHKVVNNEDHEREVKYQLNHKKYTDVVRSLSPKVLETYGPEDILAVTRMIDVGANVNLEDPMSTELTDAQLERVFPQAKRERSNNPYSINDPMWLSHYAPKKTWMSDDGAASQADSGSVTMAESVASEPTKVLPADGPLLQQNSGGKPDVKYSPELQEKILKFKELTSPDVYRPNVEIKAPAKPPDNSPEYVVAKYIKEMHEAEDKNRAKRQHVDAIKALMREIDALGEKHGEQALGSKLYTEAVNYTNSLGLKDEPPNAPKYVDKNGEKREQSAKEKEHYEQTIKELQEALKVHPWGFEIPTYIPRRKEEIAFGVESLNKIKKLIDDINRSDTNHHNKGTSIFNRYLGNGNLANMSDGDKINSVFIKRIYESGGSLYGDEDAGKVVLTPAMIQRNIEPQNHKTKSIARSKTPDINEMLRSASNAQNDLYASELIRGTGQPPPGRFEGRKMENELRNKQKDALISELGGLLYNMSWGFENYAGSDEKDQVEYFKSGLNSFKKIEQIVADLNSLLRDTEEKYGPAGDNAFVDYIAKHVYPSYGETLKKYGDIYSDPKTMTVANIRRSLSDALASGSSSVYIPEASMPSTRPEQIGHPTDTSAASIDDEIDNFINEISKQNGVGANTQPVTNTTEVSMEDVVDVGDALEIEEKPQSKMVEVQLVDQSERPSEPRDPDNVLVFDEFDDEKVGVNDVFRLYDSLVRSLPGNAHNDKYLKAESDALRTLRNDMRDWNGKVITKLPKWMPDIMLGDIRKFTPENDSFYDNNKDVVDQYKELMDEYVSSIRDFQFMPAVKGQNYPGVAVFKSGKSTSPDAKVAGGQVLNTTTSGSIGVINVDEDDGALSKSDKNTGLFAVQFADGEIAAGEDGNVLLFIDRDEAEAVKESIRKDFVAQGKNELIRYSKSMDGMFVGASPDGKFVYVLRNAMGPDGKPYSKVDRWNIAEQKVSISDAQADKFVKKSQMEQPKEGDYVSINNGQPAKITKVNPDGKTVEVDNNGSKAVADTTQPQTEIIVSMDNAVSSQQPANAQGQQSNIQQLQPGKDTTMQQQQTSNNNTQTSQSPIPGADNQLNVPTITPGPNMTLNKSYS